MTTLWDKGTAMDAAIAAFTVGDDWRLDQRLIVHDAAGSAAHARTLGHIGLIAGDEVQALVRALAAIACEAQAGRFALTPEHEDCHTAIELALTERLGDIGRKIHTARSRNDQVLTALRLYERQALATLGAMLAGVAAAFVNHARQESATLVPGYTHLQRAMPTTVGAWSAAFAELLLDDATLLAGVHALIDRSPLGSAAGFGVPFALDRAYAAEWLGFAGIQHNAIAVANSRGKLEAVLASTLATALADLGRFAADIVLFATAEFGFVALPEAFTTGSSIMPQKRNPDALELVRAHAATALARAHEIALVPLKLPSSYHRDLQLTKGPLFSVIDQATAALTVVGRLVPDLVWDRERCRAACTPEVYATHAAYKKVAAGMPFRQAYQAVAAELAAGKAPEVPSPAATIAALEHAGAPGNLGLDALLARAEAAEAQWAQKLESHVAAEARVLDAGIR